MYHELEEFQVTKSFKLRRAMSQSLTATYKCKHAHATSH